MIVINFAHPLTPAHLEDITRLTTHSITRVIDVRSQVDVQQPLTPQIVGLIDAAGLTTEEWQTTQLVVNLPALNYSAAILLAELHGRMGYFPACLRLRPVPDTVPPRFEIAEILNLQATREHARQTRERSSNPL